MAAMPRDIASSILAQGHRPSQIMRQWLITAAQSPHGLRPPPPPVFAPRRATEADGLTDWLEGLARVARQFGASR